LLLYDNIPAVTHTGHIHSALAGGVNIGCQLDFILAHWSCYCLPCVGGLTIQTVNMRPEHLKDALK